MRRRLIGFGGGFVLYGVGAVRRRESIMVDALPDRSLMQRILDALAEWQMRQSLRAICRGRRRT
jgi:hypothetical protein